MDDIGSLDPFLYVGDDVDREVGLEKLLQCVFADFSLYLHTSLIRFATRIFYGTLGHLELLLLLPEELLILETYLICLELGSLFCLFFRFFFCLFLSVESGSFEF